MSNPGAFKCTECPAGFVYVPESCTTTHGVSCGPSDPVCVHYVAPTCKYCGATCPLTPPPSPPAPAAAPTAPAPAPTESKGGSPKGEPKGKGKRTRSLREMEEMMEVEV